MANRQNKWLNAAQAQIKRVTDPDLMGRIRRKIERRKAQSFGAIYLNSYGWQDSLKLQRPIDETGEPIPWITYPALEVLRKIAAPHQRVFEFGCGHSSLWWAKRVSTVISVEHDPDFAAEISAKAPPNLTIIHRAREAPHEPSHLVTQFFEETPNLPTSGDRELDVFQSVGCRDFISYASEIERHEPFDIVIVDGMARSLTAWLAAHCLKPHGIVIFDNSNRWQYNPGYLALSKMGFGRIDYWGPGPIGTYVWCTSIFCRDLHWTTPSLLIDESNKTDMGW